LELVDIMISNNKYTEAADILVQTNGYLINQAVEYYNKGNSFMQALRESMKVKDDNEKR